MLAHIHPEVVWRPSGLLPDTDEVYRGKEGVRRFWRQFGEPWSEVSVEIDRVLDERPGQLLAEVRFRVRGRSGTDVDASFFHLYRLRDGLLIDFRSFAREDEARLEAGLEP